MDRRRFVSFVPTALLVAPFTARAQPAGRGYRVGALSLTHFNMTFAQALTPGLAARGYVVGRNLVFEERTADGKLDRLPALAAELVALKVDLIVAGAAAAIRAARDATTTIPIIMAFSGDDPVKNGFVASLARPGGNVTGVTALVRDIAPKSMELLRDAVPGMTRIAILINPSRPEHAEYVRALQAVRPQGVEFLTAEARGPDQYEAAFATMAKGRAEGLVILGDVAFSRDSRPLAELAMRHRLASVYPFRVYVQQGGLLAVGPDEKQLIELATDYIDKIFKGANPGELPVQQPTTFVIAINLVTAGKLGLVIPQSVQYRADEVIR